MRTTADAGSEAACFKLMRELTDCRVVATFTTDGEPISKARARFTNYGSQTRAYTPKKTRQGEELVAWKFRQAAPGWKVDGDSTYGVMCLFFNGTRQRRDVDNMVKLILDGLNNVCWVDDNQVTEISARKSHEPDKAHARTEVMIYQLSPVSVTWDKKECTWCGGEFRTYPSQREGTKYCSLECREAHRIDRRKCTCENCGNEYLAHGEEKAKSKRFCSRECLSEYGRTTVRCAICSEEFEMVRSWVKERNYCSDKCRRERDRLKHKERRTTHFPGTCLICGSGTTRKEYKRCNPCKLARRKLPEPEDQ